MRFASCRVGVAFLAVMAAVLAETAIGAAGPDPSASPAAAPALKVLRHLSFTIGTYVENRTDTKVSGIEGPPSGTASDTGTAVGKGSISVDVMAVTGDGGIVVDVSEDTDTRKAAPVRVAILNNRLLYDPKSDVTEEETDILRFLSRTFVKAGELDVGTTWDDNAQTAQSVDHSTYRVTAVDADAKTIDVAIDETTSVSGPRGFEGRTEGTVTYDTAVLVPLSLTLSTRRRSTQPGQLTTVDVKLTSRLTSDSFRRPAGS